MIKKIRKIIRKFLFPHKHPHPYYDFVNHDNYTELYEKFCRQTATKPSLWRRDRFYTLYSTCSEYVDNLDGAVADCGVWKGLSSLIILNSLKSDYFTGGKNFYAIDSFRGLSEPSAEDGVPKAYQGTLAASLEEVKNNLRGYPEVTFTKGWVPQILSSLPEKQWRMVHIDLDLIDPTLGAIDYFYPRLVSSGIIICDDYASRMFPNLKNAVDKFIKSRRYKTLALPTCQLLIFK